MQVNQTSKNLLLEIFALDLRSLALFRIGLALILLWGITLFSLETTFFFTDQGVMQREALKQIEFPLSIVWWISPHFLSGSIAWQVFLLSLSAVTAFSLLVGYRTKLALAISLFLLLGSHARQPMILQGNDVLLRCALFWSLFLPLGARWSIDSLKKTIVPFSSNRIISWGSAALILQLGIVYFNAAIPKMSYEWVGDGSALYYVLNMDYFSKPFGYWMIQFPTLLSLLTKQTLLIEFAVPFLILMPVGNSIIRLLVIAMMWGFHLGIYFCMDVGLFSPMCMVYWLVFLPSCFWDFLDKYLPFQLMKGFNESNQPSILAMKYSRWLILGLLLYVLVLNQKRYLNPPHSSDQREWFYLPAKITGLDQFWAMFSPSISRESIKINLLGIKTDGTAVDLLHPESATSSPNTRSGWEENDPYLRKRFFLLSLYEFHHEAFSDAILRFFMNHWNQSHDKNNQIITGRIVIKKKETPPPFNANDFLPKVTETILVEIQLP